MDYTSKTTIEMQAQIFELLNRHSLEAQASQYDRSVCISAIAAARKNIDHVRVDGSAESYCRHVLQDLIRLQETYNDTDGKYTNGRGILGSLIGDISLLLIDDDSR